MALDTLIVAEGPASRAPSEITLLEGRVEPTPVIGKLKNILIRKRLRQGSKGRKKALAEIYLIQSCGAQFLQPLMTGSAL
jgi:hypothetical protein